MWDALCLDVRHSVRSLRGAPTFSLFVIVTLALAVGATAAIGSLLNALVFRTLAVPSPGQLVALSAFEPRASVEGYFYPDTVKSKGKTGVYYLGNRETYNSLGFNTTLISSNDAPKTFKDLLDPKWKSKMSIAGTSTGVRWVGSIIEVMGREFLDKLAEQEIKVQDMSGAALAGLVASAEVPLSPTIFDADVTVAKQKGAPIEWRPLEPVVTTVGYSALSSKAPHPHAALLFLDYVHSKEGQLLMTKGGLWSPREDTGTRQQKFKKIYLDEKFSLAEIEGKFSQWETLVRQLFIKRK